MPVCFSRIRIAGFKSFAEPSVIALRPGLTGIVGPNGCGKSNVVEALRWVMGESSARSLRGGEMDDLIFAGTAHRPARNITEVTLTLEPGPDAAFPPPFDRQSELEVGRRIERGSGSSFRVNGKDARARDVQTLFADLASGARASAMVSQGRVGALVGARPDERRAILEEAAGIGGLHSRRHEAELKLRAAEANLARAEDLRTQLTAQLAGLHKQARQAGRYRSLSGLIRAAETELFAVQLARAVAAREQARAGLAACREALDRAADCAVLHAAAATEIAAGVPALREEHAVARTVLERRRMAREQVAGAQAGAEAALAAAREALGRIERDRRHAGQARAEAIAAGERLAEEAVRLGEQARTLPELAEGAAAALTAAEAALLQADARMHEATSAAAFLAARGQALADARDRGAARGRALDVAWQQLGRARAGHQAVEPAALDQARAAIEAAEEAVGGLAGRLEQAELAQVAAQARLRAAQAALDETGTQQALLAAEQRALGEVLQVHGDGGAQRLVDGLTVPEGLEAAIGAALGEELELATDGAAPRHMRVLPPLDAGAVLPEGASPLAALVAAPPALARALGAVGLVDAARGAALQPGLGAGQVLVSRGGGVWRWDGFVQQEGAPTQAAIRLRQRNRLAELRGLCAAAGQAHAASRSAHGQEAAAEARAVEAESAARAARRGAEQALERHRAALHVLQRNAEVQLARIALLDGQIENLAAERAAAQAEDVAARAACEALPDPAAARAEVDRARTALAAARAQDQRARTELDSLQRQASAGQARLRTILGERAGWTERAREAEVRAADYDLRHEAAEAAVAEGAARPALLAAACVQADAAEAKAAAAHAAAAERLARAEAAQAAADRADRAAAMELAGAREGVLRAESDLRTADHAWGTVSERILERLGSSPDLPAPPDLPPDLSVEAESRARGRFDRLTRERAEMGPVNLCAEAEAGEIQTRLASIDHDRDELTTAINKLRGSIGHLNREGRERLAGVFAEVDRHFQHLFARMFGGGRAHLALVGSDDPLQAGLEIYAQPPGKKLSALSLLSGGEQALTALSLIFAVFRCNPAPVCVLDEVDAPLDDANIERFCALLDDMVRETGTRFLVVTHHHMTMARMDQLYGVTMQERGVSQLLSVDLRTAAGLVDPVAIAAE